jgi:hypothetical protein
MKKKLSVFFLLIVMVPIVVVADGKNWDPYPKYIHHCLEAMNYHIGKEKEYVELMSVEEVGNSDCKISAIFKNQNNINKFSELRTKQGKDPNFVIYKQHKIPIVKRIVETVSH